MATESTTTATWFEQLPDGYELRVPAKLAKATRGRFTRDWYFMLRDLYEGGGYGWQRWGAGHISSGITKALTARRFIETAESKNAPLLFRLTRAGESKLMELYEERAEFAEKHGEEYVMPEPPEGAPRQPMRQLRKLDERDAHVLAVWEDERDGVRNGIASMNALLQTEDAPFVDREHLARLHRRENELNKSIANLRYVD